MLTSNGQIQIAEYEGRECVEFNADSDYIEWDVNIGTNAMPILTLAVDVYVSSIPNNRGWLFGDENGGCDRYILLHDDRVGTNQTGASCKSMNQWDSPPVKVKAWNTIVAFYNETAKTSYIYINGVKSTIRSSNHDEGNGKLRLGSPWGGHTTDTCVAKALVYDFEFTSEQVFAFASFASDFPPNPIPNANWKAFVDACLAEVGAEITGECTSWASGNDYGTMPNWDVSLVTDMTGYAIDIMTGYYTLEGFRGKSTFNADISKWNTEKVTDMRLLFASASAFNQDISSWTGTAATTAQSEMFLDATAFQAKFACTDAITGPANSCFERLVNLETCSVLYEAISPVLPFLKAATVDFPADHSTFGSNYAYYVYAEITTGSTFNSYEDVYLLGGTSACGSWFGGLYHGRPFIGTQCNWGSSTAAGVDQTTATVALQANQTYRIQWMYNVAEGYRRAQIKVDGVVVVDSTTAYLNVDSSSTEEFLSIGSGYHTQVSETLQGSVKKVSVHICGENI
ncbi:unnamed protein product [Bathycoccus prasinos]